MLRAYFLYSQLNIFYIKKSPESPGIKPIRKKVINYFNLTKEISMKTVRNLSY